MARIAVIGAGISGLSAAYWLQNSGHDVHVFEKSDRTGGVVQTHREGEFLFEAGPSSFLDNAPDTMDLCAAVGLEDQLERNPLRENARYIYVNGALREVPMGPGGLVTTSILSSRAKLRLLKEPFVKANRAKQDESLGAFISRRFGNEVLNNVVTPFITGVYAGDPRQLSLRALFPLLYDLEREHGSVIGGMFKKLLGKKKQSPSPKKKTRAKNLCSWKDGMQAMPDTIAERVKDSIHLSTKVVRIEKSQNGFNVSTEGEGINNDMFDVVIFATPCYEVMDLAGNFLSTTGSYLKEIPLNRVTVLGIGCEKENVAHNCEGFGFLVPRDQGIRILGSIWCSSVFSGRAPENRHCFSVFIGGKLDPIAFDLSDEELHAQAQIDLSTIVGVQGPFTQVQTFRWDRAIPQYPVGHVEKIGAVQEELAQTPGLFLTGNYLDGVSTNDCIRLARKCSQDVIEYLK